MAQSTHGTGGLDFDKKKRTWPNELNIFIALILIIAIFEALGQTLPYMNDQSFLFDSRDRFDSIFNEARLRIIILQVSIIGIIALGVTQVIISGGIDLSSGPLVGATAMIVMSFAQTELVNGNPNPKAVFGEWAFDLPILIPIVVGLAFGALIGAINGSFIAYTRIPPFIATLGMFLICRGIAQAWTRGKPVSFPTEGYTALGSGMMPVYWFIGLAVVFHFVLKYTVYAIAMAVIGGVSLTGGRGSIIGTVLGAMVFGVIQSGFTYVKLDAYFQLMAMGAIIIGAVVLDKVRQERAAKRK